MKLWDVDTGSEIAGPSGSPGSPGGSGGGCIIATAAYGTPMAEEIDTLRAVRDAYMLNHAFGAAFVDTYYRVSPPIADIITKSEGSRAVVRLLLLPIIVLSNSALAAPVSILLLLSAAALLLTYAALHRRNHASQAH